MAHSVAVAADRNDMAVVDQPVDQSGSHDVVAEDVTPVLKAFVRGEHGRGVLVTTSHELEEEHGAGAADRQVADLVQRRAVLVQQAGASCQGIEYRIVVVRWCEF